MRRKWRVVTNVVGKKMRSYHSSHGRAVKYARAFGGRVVGRSWRRR